MSKGKRAGVIAAATFMVFATVGVGVVWSQRDRAASGAQANQGGVSLHLTASEASTAAGVRVFFGHQSVGGNVLGQVPAVYRANGRAEPAVLHVEAGVLELPAPPAVGGFWVETLIGRNRDPLGKIADFDSRIRGGIGGQVDVALMKLCYVDFNADTDIETVFTAYRDTMAALERDYPEVTFIYATAPLTTEPTSTEGFVKELLGRTRVSGNVAREHYNALIRAEYGGDRLFDLAAVESTRPDGTREVRGIEGEQHFALYGGYASDPGHLNETGSELAAAELVGVIARAVNSQ